MSDYIRKHFYAVTQLIDGELNFYSHWERLHPESKVYGVVWNKYLCYGFMFVTKQAAKKMRSRIIQYDSNGKYKITPISAGRYERALKFVNGLQNDGVSAEILEIELEKFVW